MNTRAMTPIIAVILLVMIAIALSAGAMTWIFKIQKSSEQSTEESSKHLVKLVQVEARVADDPIYNTFGETRPCQPATVELTVENIGATNIPVLPSDTSPKMQLSILNKGQFICTSDVSGTCLKSESYIYAGTGSNGKIYRSSDGTTWSEVVNLNDVSIDSLIKFGELYLAGSYSNGYIYLSCRGTDWDWKNSFLKKKVSSMENFGDYIYAGTEINGTIFRSSNGVNWTLVYDTGESNVYSLKSFGSYLYAGTGTNGKIFRSSDGTTWSEVASNNGSRVYALEEFENYLYAGTGINGTIYRSSDGISWSIANKTIYKNIMSLKTFGNNIYAGTGNISDAAILKSSDGVNWNTVNNTGQDNIYALYEFNGYLYAGTGSNGKIYRSSDGTTWSEVASGLSTSIKSFTNFSRCINAKVNCTEGCESDIPKGATRLMKFKLSDTDCDLSEYGKETGFQFELNFGSGGSANPVPTAGKFTKEALPDTISTPCIGSAPTCNGACPSGYTCGYDSPSGFCGCVEDEAICEELTNNCGEGGGSCASGVCLASGNSCVCQDPPEQGCTSEPSCDSTCLPYDGYSPDGGTTCFSDPDCLIQCGACQRLNDGDTSNCINNGGQWCKENSKCIHADEYCGSPPEIYDSSCNNCEGNGYKYNSSLGICFNENLQSCGADALGCSITCSSYGDFASCDANPPCYWCPNHLPADSGPCADDVASCPPLGA